MCRSSSGTPGVAQAVARSWRDRDEAPLRERALGGFSTGEAGRLGAYPALSRLTAGGSSPALTSSHRARRTALSRRRGWVGITPSRQR